MTNSSRSRCDLRKQPRRAHYALSVLFLSLLAAILLAGLLGHQRLEASTADETVFYPDRVIERLDQQSQQTSWPDGIREVLFVDPAISDLKALLRGLPPSIETLILDPERDGVRQMIAGPAPPARCASDPYSFPWRAWDAHTRCRCSACQPFGRAGARTCRRARCRAG